MEATILLNLRRKRKNGIDKSMRKMDAEKRVRPAVQGAGPGGPEPIAPECWEGPGPNISAPGPKVPEAC